MKRRDFIAGLGGAVAWPLVGRAQRPVMPVIDNTSNSSATRWIAGIGGGSCEAEKKRPAAASGHLHQIEPEPRASGVP